jgi:tetratricopeptide (TPR) repeat protein
VKLINSIFRDVSIGISTPKKGSARASSISSGRSRKIRPTPWLIPVWLTPTALLGELSVAPPKESFPQARAYAEKALALDETLADAHLSLGIVELLYEWDWPGAEKELRRAKELDPNNPQVYHFYAHYLQSVERMEESIDETKRGVELDPTSLVVNAELGWAYYCARHHDQAIAQGRKTLDLDPNFVYTSWVIAQSYEQTERYQESVAELKRARTIDANWPYIIAELGYAYAVSV